METLGPLELAFAALVLVTAYAVRGTAGFGGQTLAVPLLVLVLPLPTVVSTVVVFTMMSSIGHWMRDWRRISWREIARLLPYSLAGVLAGLYVLHQVEMRTLIRILGVFIIFYSIFALATANRPLRIAGRYRGAARAAFSTLAGAASAVFGAGSGPIYAIYFNQLWMERDVFRVTITTILAFQASLRIAGYVQLGFYDQDVLILVAAGVPMVVIGAGIGDWLAGRLDQHWFDRGISALLLVSGVALLLK